MATLPATPHPAPNDDTPVLEVRGISKSYGPVRANRDVSMILRAGSVHAVLGENGAGKSTLMKMLFGVEQPDSGEILVAGKPVTLRSPREAIDVGIGMVFQHFGLVGELTALDNIALGAETGGPLRVDRAAARERVKALAAELGFDVPTEAKVEDVSVSQQQRIEILKAVYRGAKILILDEPTALLTPQERQGLFQAIRRLQGTGMSVLFITHKLDEADQLADDVTVMRLGRVVARRAIGRVTHEQLILDMVGHSDVVTSRTHRVGTDAAIEITDVGAKLETGYPLEGLTLEARRGEVLALVGIDGHGHQLACQILAGVVKPASGSIRMDGKPVRRWNRSVAMERRIAYVPEDRLSAGVARAESIADNLIANRLRDRSFVTAGVIRRGKVAEHAEALIGRFDIRCRDRDQASGRLSGGNVQKVVLAREISIRPKVLVVCEPTRGLDIGAIHNIHGRIAEAADQGAAVVVQTSDLDEVLQLADRIVVFREGAVVADLANTIGLTVEDLGAQMLGRKDQAHA